MNEGSATILIVDDDPGVCRLIERSLRREGYRSHSVGTGKEALVWLADHAADLMLLDLNLPDMMGQKVLHELAKAGRTLPFIIITGRGDERVAVEMMKSGAIDYVVKDRDFLELVPRILSRALNQIGYERKLAAAEENLRKEHAFISAVLDTAGALVVVLDREGRIVRFNHACERATGYRLEEVKGQKVFDLFIPPDERAQVQEVFKHLACGLRRSDHENHWLTRHGGKRFIQWSNTILLAADGSVEHVIATGIDVTHRKELERQLAQVEEQVKQRIGRDLHDDLCQRLAGIEIMSQVLEKNLAAKSKREAASAGEISKLIREAIAHTRDLARGLTPVVLESEGLMSALTQLAASTQKMFRIRCVFECDEPVLVPDNTVATHLYRIAQEAVNNAVKHAEAGEIEIRLTKTPERVTLCVKDNGKGIPEKIASGKGMGLGIMQYRAGVIVGSLAVERLPKGGTAVICSLHTAGTKSKKGEA
ncbi:MAG: response regulator [Verrucomicrobiota bacterium]